MLYYTSLAVISLSPSLSLSLHSALYSHWCLCCSLTALVWLQCHLQNWRVHRNHGLISTTTNFGRFLCMECAFRVGLLSAAYDFHSGSDSDSLVLWPLFCIYIDCNNFLWLSALFCCALHCVRMDYGMYEFGKHWRTPLNLLFCLMFELLQFGKIERENTRHEWMNERLQ